MKKLLWSSLLLFICSCSSQPEQAKYTARYCKIEDIIVNSPDHDGVPIAETEYKFGPHKVRFDDVNCRVYINDQDYGAVKTGDEVKLGPQITVNGQPRQPIK